MYRCEYFVSGKMTSSMKHSCYHEFFVLQVDGIQNSRSSIGSAGNEHPPETVHLLVDALKFIQNSVRPLFCCCDRDAGDLTLS